ncbi:MAG: CehA/McbA family metallohydrolase [Clostridia bacterium]|nr:CehA/McbA family metallohydrolase [Clostridia bacterium]
MIRQQAFCEKRKMLKGGLHCHTTRSDGTTTPEDTIRYHKEKGYDFLALTDHRLYNYKNFAPETDITIIPGMEYNNHQVEGISGIRTFHTVCIGPLKEDGNLYDQDEYFPSVRADTQEEYQATLDTIHKKGNLTIYCHPQWSATSVVHFGKLTGNFAMEIFNSGCAMDNELDTDAAYWDELLGMGKKIYGVAVDDGHTKAQHCNGWVMVNSENTVKDILSALEDGRFYSSCGPEIYDFYVEGDHAFVDCSPVSKIRLHSDRHPTTIVRDADGRITHAEFDLTKNFAPYDYVRISVGDSEGKLAWTNPIFLK